MFEPIAGFDGARLHALLPIGPYKMPVKSPAWPHHMSPYEVPPL